MTICGVSSPIRIADEDAVTARGPDLETLHNRMGYEEPPWVFRGRALYQLQLVKVSEARKYVPESLKLVNFFGYTLGGFYLARYTDSPVGAFDEVAMMQKTPGLSIVVQAHFMLPGNRNQVQWTARDHGLQTVGLPSRQALFEQDRSVTMHGRRDWWLGPEAAHGGTGAKQPGSYSSGDSNQEVAAHPLVLRNAEGSPWWCRQRSARGLAQPVCRLTLPLAPRGWPGPRMTILLPSFSGATEDCPELLKYTCRLRTNASPIKPATIEVGANAGSLEALAPVLGGRPLFAFSFHDMELSVKEPTLLKASSRRISEKQSVEVAAA